MLIRNWSIRFSTSKFLANTLKKLQNGTSFNNLYKLVRGIQELIENVIDSYRFAQFFISPLCKREATDRELQAIEDEFAAATQEDYTRLEAVMAHTSDCSHVMHKFSWGNIQSLRDTPARYNKDPHDALFRLFKSMYSADRIHVVARAPYPLDTLEELIAPIFGKIPKRGGLAEYTPKEIADSIEHSKEP